MVKKPADMTTGEALSHLISGFWWFGRTLFWAMMIHCVIPFAAPLFPPDARENLLLGCMRSGMKLLEEARDKGFITEECYDENKSNFG